MAWPRISIVVPFYQSRDTIAQCADALVAQAYPRDRFEIIMVDNNSTDGSVDIVRQYPNVRMVAEREQGAYAARNAGVRAAQGEIIAFTDADCTPASDWLVVMGAAMTDPQLQVVMGSPRFTRRGGLLSMLEAYEDEKKRFVIDGSDGLLYHGQCNNMAVRRQVFEEMGGFVETPRGADTVLVRRIVDRFGADAVGHATRLRVVHLEIDSVLAHLRKVAIYWRSRRECQRFVAQRGLTNRERRLVYWRTVRRQGYGLMQAGRLWALLSCGWAYCKVASTLPVRRG